MTRAYQTLSHPAFRFKTFTVGQELPLFLRGSSFDVLQVPRGPIAFVNRTARAKKGARCLTRARSSYARDRSPPSLPRVLRGQQTNGGLGACSTWELPLAITCKAEILTCASGLEPFCVSASTAGCHFASPRRASVDLPEAHPSRLPRTTLISQEIRDSDSANGRVRSHE